MEGQLGILVGGWTELALFTAINSLPLTAYRFLLLESLASCSSAFLDSPRHPHACRLRSPLWLSVPIAVAIRNNLGVFFLRHVPLHKNVVHGRLKPR